MDNVQRLHIVLHLLLLQIQSRTGLCPDLPCITNGPLLQFLLYSAQLGADAQVRDHPRLRPLIHVILYHGAGRVYALITSGRQLLQTPRYVVRARRDNPLEQLLLAVDASNDAAWLPCSGCMGCPYRHTLQPDQVHFLPRRALPARKRSTRLPAPAPCSGTMFTWLVAPYAAVRDKPQVCSIDRG